jgi:hypothetical protein
MLANRCSPIYNTPCLISSHDPPLEYSLPERTLISLSSYIVIYVMSSYKQPFPIIPATPCKALYSHVPYASVSVPFTEGARLTFCNAILKQGCRAEQLIVAVAFFVGNVYPVKFTKAIFEISIFDVPAYDPLSPLSCVIYGPDAAPWIQKFSNRIFCTTPLVIDLLSVVYFIF